MSPAEMVLVINKPFMTVKLDQRMLQVDLESGLKQQLESALESNEAIRETLGFLFQSVIPLDVPLKDIDSASLSSDGKVKIAIPFRRDIHIPLEPDESKRLVDKLNQLIPEAKALHAQEVSQSNQRKREIASGERLMPYTPSIR